MTTLLSKCTGTSNAGTWGGKINPTGENTFLGTETPTINFLLIMMPHRIQWHCTALIIFQFVNPCSAGNSKQPTWIDIFKDPSEQKQHCKTILLICPTFLPSCMMYLSWQYPFCFVLPGEADHEILPALWSLCDINSTDLYGWKSTQQDGQQQFLL